MINHPLCSPADSQRLISSHRDPQFELDLPQQYLHLRHLKDMDLI